MWLDGGWFTLPQFCWSSLIFWILYASFLSGYLSCIILCTRVMSLIAFKKKSRERERERERIVTYWENISSKPELWGLLLLLIARNYAQIRIRWSWFINIFYSWRVTSIYMPSLFTFKSHLNRKVHNIE